MRRLRSIRRWGAPLLVSAWLVGCAGSRNTPVTDAPEWVQHRPVSMSHYIGIGSAVQVPMPGEALRTAKERAAADLAAEISVKVQSASLLESADNNGQVSERFSSTISSRSEASIEGFEVFDTWQDKNRVHVYYRLDKARHAAARARRQSAAIESALAECRAGNEDRDAGRVAQALNHWGTGIMALEEFWNEVNKGSVDGREVNLEPHMVRSMRETVQSLEITTEMGGIVLDAGNGFAFPLGLQVSMNGIPASGVPVRYAYHGGDYMKRATEFSDDGGMLVALVSGVRGDRPDRDFTATVDLDRLRNAAGLDPVVASLVGSPPLAEFRMPVEVTMPAIHIALAVEGDVTTQEAAGVVQATRIAMRREGFEVLEVPGGADFGIEILLRKEIRTSPDHLGQFQTVYVEGALRARDAQGQWVEELALERVKGVQLDTDAALRVALANMGELIDGKLARRLAEALR